MKEKLHAWHSSLHAHLWIMRPCFLPAHQMPTPFLRLRHVGAFLWAGSIANGGESTVGSTASRWRLAAVPHHSSWLQVRALYPLQGRQQHMQSVSGLSAPRRAFVLQCAVGKPSRCEAGEMLRHQWIHWDSAGLPRWRLRVADAG